MKVEMSKELAFKILPGKSLAYAHRLMRKANSKCLINRLTDIAIYSLSDKDKGFFIFDGSNHSDVNRAIRETDSRALELSKKSTAYKCDIKKQKKERCADENNNQYVQ